MRIVGLAAFALLTGCNSAPTTTDTREATAESPNDRKMWVTSQYLDRHTCPSESCGIVGRLSFREAATVLEIKNGWTRITKFYDASCVNGVSKYVEKGTANCTAENGISDKRFAEWVLSKNLSSTRPADPAETATAEESLVAQSDDFTQYRETFTKAARQLISGGRCTAADFREMGGWLKSTTERDRPIYFTYCGGMTTSNRLYLNAATGEIFT